MALCVNTSSPLFKTLAEKYDLSNGRLEQLIHQYDRIAGTSQTTEALEKFIQDNLNGKENVVSAKAIESALALWNRDFSVPRVFASMKEAAAYAAQAERYFDPKAVITKETRAGNYEVRVNKPAQISDSSLYLQYRNADVQRKREYLVQYYAPAIYAKNKLYFDTRKEQLEKYNNDQVFKFRNPIERKNLLESANDYAEFIKKEFSAILSDFQVVVDDYKGTISFRPKYIKDSVLSAGARSYVNQMSDEAVLSEFQRLQSEYDNLEYHIRAKDIDTIKAQIAKKNKFMADEEINLAVDFLAELEDTPELNRYVSDCIRWLKNNTIRLPQDNDVVLAAFKEARKRGLDVGSYKHPMGILLDSQKSVEVDMKSVKPTDGFSTPGFTYVREDTIAGGEVVQIFNVEDSPVGRQSLSQAIADGTPKAKNGEWLYKESNFSSPWCIGTFNYDVKTGIATRTTSADRYWKMYDRPTRQVALLNGVPIAMNATHASHNADEWWDYSDQPHSSLSEVPNVRQDTLTKMARRTFEDYEVGGMHVTLFNGKVAVVSTPEFELSAPKLQRFQEGNIYGLDGALYTAMCTERDGTITKQSPISNSDRTAYIRINKDILESDKPLTKDDFTIKVGPSYAHHDATLSVLNGYLMRAKAPVLLHKDLRLLKKNELIHYIREFEAIEEATKPDIHYDALIDVFNNIRETAKLISNKENADLLNTVDIEEIARGRISKEALKAIDLISKIENAVHGVVRNGYNLVVSKRDADKEAALIKDLKDTINTRRERESILAAAIEKQKKVIKFETAVTDSAFKPLGVFGNSGIFGDTKRSVVDTEIQHEYNSYLEDSDFSESEKKSLKEKLKNLVPDFVVNAVADMLKEADIESKYQKGLKSMVNEDLEGTLKGILEHYHFAVREETAEDMINAFGGDVLGVLDTLNKAIYIATSENRNSLTFPEEFSHAFIKLMGAVYHRPENRSKFPETEKYSELRDLIETTELYKRVVDEYGKLPMYTREDGSMDTAKLKEEALGQALAAVIVDENSLPETNRTFFQKVKDWFKSVLRRFAGLFSDSIYLNNELRKISDAIKDGTYFHKYLQKINNTENWERQTLASSIEKAAMENPRAIELIKNIGNRGGILTGSLSYREQGSTYRSSVDDLHDIDFVIPAGRHSFFVSHPYFRNRKAVKDDRAYSPDEVVDLVKQEPIVASILQDNPTLSILYAYMAGNNNLVINLIDCEDASIKDKFKNLKGNFNKRLASFTPEERKKINLVDIFLDKSGNIQSTGYAKDYNSANGIEYLTISLADFKYSFSAKLGYGRAKDIFDYQNFNPNEGVRNNLMSPGLYFQKRGDNSNTDSAANSSKSTSLDINYSKGNNQILSNFASRMFALDTKSANSVVSALEAAGVDSGIAEWMFGLKFKSVEMAFQYAKTYFSSALTPVYAYELYQQMYDSSSPYELKNLGRSIPLTADEIKLWNESKSGIMKVLIKESMLQNEDARINLLATAGKELTHSVQGEWQTEFPRILMEVREELLKAETKEEVKTVAKQIADDPVVNISKEVSKAHQAYQEKSLAQQQKLRNLQESLTETEINEASQEVMWTIMDKLDAYFDDPQTLYDEFKSAFGYELPVRKDDEEIREMSRADLIEMMGTDNFLNIVRKSLYEWNEAVDDMSPADFDKTAILNENFDAVLVKVIKNISKFEDFVIPYNLNENTFGKLQENTSEVTLGEDETIENDSESENREVDENNVEGYFIDKKTQSIWTTTTRMVRRVIQNLIEYDAQGNPITTVRGVKKRMNPLVATQTIEKIVSSSMTVKEMIARLSDQLSLYPEVAPIIDKLKSTEPEDTQFQSQFFNAFDRHRMEFSGVVENSNGTLSSKTFNLHTAKSNVIKAAKGMVRSGSTAVFEEGGYVTKKGLATYIKDVNTAFSGKYADIAKSAEAFENTAAAIAQVMNDLGFEVPVEDIVKILDKNSYARMQNAARNIAENLGRVVDVKTYEPFKVSKDNPNGIYGYFSALVTPVTDIWEDTQVASFYDHGKMYQSYLLPSWMSKLAIKFHSDPANFRNYINNEYGKYEWFRKQNEDPELPSSYRNYILQMLVANADSPEQRDKIFKHKTQLSFKGRQYMRDLGHQDYAVSMLAEFTSMLNDGKNIQFGYYPIPIESNKPSAEYISLPVFLGDNFKEKITQHLVDIFIQEVMRIKTVKMRKKLDADSPLLIKDFDKRGDKFCILTWFNDYLNSDEASLDADGLELKKYLEELTSIEAANPTQDDDIMAENRRSKLIQDAIREAIDKEVAITAALWTNQGVSAAAVNIENAGKFADAEGKVDFNALVEAYVWNYTLAASGILEIAITDPAFYPNYEQLQKRLGQLHSPGSRPNIEALDYKTGKPVSDGIHRHIVFADDELEKAGKFFASNTIDNLKHVFDKAIANERNELKKERLREMKEDAVKAYSGMDFTNAQAYSSPTSYRKKAHMFGKWSAKHQALYEKITGIRYNSDGTYTRNPKLAIDASFEDLEFIFQPLKPFLYSTTTVSSGVNSEMTDIKTNIQVKDAEYLLTVVGMFNEAQYKGKQTEGKPNLLRAIYEVMEESADVNSGRGIDTVVFDSTTKTGLHAPMDISSFYDDPNGEENLKNYLRNKIYLLDRQGNPITTSYNPAIVQESMYEDYSMQQELQDHVRDHMQIHSSQLRYNAISGLEMTDSEGNPYMISYYDGNEKVTKTLAEAIQDYEDTISESIDQSIDDVEKEFGIGGYYLSEADRKLALSIALQEQIMSDSRYSVDLLEACQINEDGEFNVAPGEDVQSSRIEQMVNSIVKTRVNKFKLFGGPAVQITNFGMSTELNMRYYDKSGNILKTKKEFLNNKELTEKYSNDYEAYVADRQDRFAYAEILAPVTSDILEKFADKNGNIDISTIEELCPRLLSVSLLRTPNENRYSSLPAKIVGFLPKASGTTVAGPYDITRQMGCDFDWDKLTMILENVNIKELDEFEFADAKKKVNERFAALAYDIRKEWEDKYADSETDERDQKLADKYTAKLNKLLERRDKVLNSPALRYKVSYPTSGQAYRANKVASLTHALLSHESATTQLVKPGGFNNLKNVGYTIAAYKNPQNTHSWEELNDMSTSELKDLALVGMNLIFPRTQQEFYKRNKVAGNILGIFAVQKIAHAILQNLGLKLRSERNFFIGDFEVKEWNDLDNMYDSSFRLIGDALSENVSGSVDAVKDPILNFMNVDESTAGILCTMLRLGMDLRTIAMFVSQDCVIEAMDEVSRRTLAGEYISFDRYITDFLNEPQFKVYEASSDDRIYNISNDELISGMLTTPSDFYRFKVISAFKEISDMSKGLRPLDARTRNNAVAAAAGPLVIDNIIQDNLEDTLNQGTLEGRVGIDLGDMDEEGNPVYLTNPEAIDSVIYGRHKILGSFRRGRGLANRILADIPTARRRFRDIVSVDNGKFGEIMSRNRDLMQKFARFYKSFVAMSTGVIPSKVRSLDAMAYFAYKYPKDFLALKKKHAGNKFVDAIKPAEEKGYVVLNIDTTGLDDTSRAELSNAWADLYKKDEEFAMNLFYYAFFRGGIGFSPKSFMKLLPTYMKERIEGYNESFADDSTPINSQALMDQFALNFYDEGSLVRGVSKKVSKEFINSIGTSGTFTATYDSFPHTGDLYIRIRKGGTYIVVKNLGDEGVSIQQDPLTGLNRKYHTYQILGKVLGNEHTFMEINAQQANVKTISPETPEMVAQAEPELTPIDGVPTTDGDIKSIALKKAEMILPKENRDRLKEMLRQSNNERALNPDRTKGFDAWVVEQAKKNGVKINKEELDEIRSEYCIFRAN